MITKHNCFPALLDGGAVGVGTEASVPFFPEDASVPTVTQLPNCFVSTHFMDNSDQKSVARRRRTYS